MNSNDNEKRIKRLENQVTALSDYLEFSYKVLFDFLATGEIQPEQLKRLLDGHKELQTLAPRQTKRN